MIQKVINCLHTSFINMLSNSEGVLQAGISIVPLEVFLQHGAHSPSQDAYQLQKVSEITPLYHECVQISRDHGQ